MTAGVFRPAQVEVQRWDASTAAYSLVSRYQFTYSDGAHYHSAWDVATEFSMLTKVRRFGNDGTKELPAQTFAYNREVVDGCREDECVRLLTEVANGYGAVTVLSYARWSSTRGQVVTKAETWDGVAFKKGTHARGQTLVVYDHSGATACFDTEDSGCEMGTQEPSEALVGFNKATVKTQEWDSENSIWKTLGTTETDFINANYLLLGKVSEQRQVDPVSGSVLVKDSYNWVDHFANDHHLAQLMLERCV